MSEERAVEIAAGLRALAAAQGQLERELEILVGNSLAAFEAAWGVSIRQVELTRVEVTAMGDPLPNFIMGSVRVELALAR